MPLPRSSNNPRCNLRGRAAFFVSLGAIALVWLVALPRLGSQPAIERYIQRNERLGIDPSAKFYTELPGIRDFQDRTRTARRQHAAAFGF